jgi:acyl-CoA thioesterase I
MGQTGVYIGCLIFILLLCGSACSKSRGAAEPVTTNNRDSIIIVTDTTKNNLPVSRRYLALGDSYTIGESVAENERYPRQLQDSLVKYNISIIDLKIIARTGWTTSELLNALAASPPNNNYDMVTLLIGVNNQYRGESLAAYSNEFTNLLGKCKQYAGNDKNKVVVISIQCGAFFKIC